ncbi:hypothetical protein [Gimesia sp.]|uniref:hypothetical protein n=1 Tax=Gimesia sp. TaxID=2024833 RepID=UPI000C5F62FE|nr:hypothetical protein [Gimesia sp.]MAX39984.1 hypothetical protein [Gimesia sp.]
MKHFVNLTPQALWRQMLLAACLLALFFPTGAAAQDDNAAPLHGYEVRGLKLDAEKPLWVVVTGAGMDKVKVNIRSSSEKQDLFKGRDIFNNYTDFKMVGFNQTNFRVLQAESIPPQITTQPVDLQISATDRKGAPARIDQVGTSNNSGEFLKALTSGKLGRDQVIAIPRRCYADKADAILTNVYTEHPACALLKIYNEEGKPVPSKQGSRFLRLRPDVIHWKEHKQVSSGIYQARVLLWYAGTAGECNMKSTDSDPDFVLYSEFQILTPP